MPRATGNVTLADMVRCAAHEMRKRPGVYEKLVRLGHMAQEDAEWQIDCLEHIHAFLEEKLLEEVRGEEKIEALEPRAH